MAETGDHVHCREQVRAARRFSIYFLIIVEKIGQFYLPDVEIKFNEVILHIIILRYSPIVNDIRPSKRNKAMPMWRKLYITESEINKITDFIVGGE